MKWRNFNQKAGFIRHAQLHVQPSDCPLTAHENSSLLEMRIHKELSISGGLQLSDHQANRGTWKRQSSCGRNASSNPAKCRFTPTNEGHIFKATAAKPSEPRVMGGFPPKKKTPGRTRRPRPGGKPTGGHGRVQPLCPINANQGGPLSTKRIRYTAEGGALASCRRIVVWGEAMLTVDTVTTLLDQAPAPFFWAIGVQVTMS